MSTNDSSPGSGSSHNIPPRSGLGDLTSSTLGALLDHFLVRIKLFQFEAGEIRGELLFKLFVLLTAFLFFALGYVALLTGGVGMLTIHYQWSWTKTLLGVGGLHIFVAFLLLMIAKKRLSQAAFRDTLREIEKDRQWLKNKHRQH